MGHHRHHRHRHRSRRRSKSVPAVEPIPAPLPPAAPRVFSNIHPIYLEESVQGGIGQYVSVSVLEPVMRVERSRGNCASDPCRKPMYRIVLSFRMQLSINRRGNELQRHNRIFDSVSVRYLYRSGEKHDLLPKGDNIVTDIGLSHETGKSSEVEAGVAGFAGHIAPGFTVHAQHASKLTYERRVASWRKALTYEAYPPLLEGKPGGGLTALFAPALHKPEPEPQSFRVSSSHAQDCTCRRFRRCRRRLSRHNPYDRAAHWTGQTEAQLHLWTPEIYENLNSPLTITREVCADEIDEILGGNGAPSYGRHVLRKYLHFDFDVEVGLREIGWGFWNFLKSSSKPPEIRGKNDYGKPLPTDKFRFCVTCCTERINWPQFETRNLQTEAEEQTALHGYVRRLQSTEEYEDSYNNNNNNNNSQATVESSSSRAATAFNPSQMRGAATCHHRRISHSPESRLRVFGRRYSLGRYLPGYHHYQEEIGPRSAQDRIYDHEDQMNIPQPFRGRGLDRDYDRPDRPPFQRRDAFHGAMPPPAPTPPLASEGTRYGHTLHTSVTPIPIPIPSFRFLPIRGRSPGRVREISPELPDSSPGHGAFSPEDYVPGRMSMSDDAKHGNDDDKNDSEPNFTTNRAKTEAKSEYEFKLLPPAESVSEDDQLALPHFPDGKEYETNEGQQMRDDLQAYDASDIGTKSPARSSYRQPTVLTISSESDREEDECEDCDEHERIGKEMREGEEGHGRHKMQLPSEISGMHGISGVVDGDASNAVVREIPKE